MSRLTAPAPAAPAVDAKPGKPKPPTATDQLTWLYSFYERLKNRSEQPAETAFLLVTADDRKMLEAIGKTMKQVEAFQDDLAKLIRGTHRLYEKK